MPIYKVFIDPYRKTPVALTPDQLDFLIETQGRQAQFGNEKTSTWLQVFANAVTVEANSPSEAEEKYVKGI